MKTVLFSLVLLPSVVFAMICPQATPLQKRYSEQQSWQNHSIKQSNGFGAIEGYVDTQNNLFLDSLTRRKRVEAQITVDKSNEDYKEFFNFCADYKGKAKYLESFRKANAGNKYRLKLTYLPSFSNFSNNPLEGISTEEVTLNIKYSSSSLLSNQAYSQESKKKIFNALQSQLNAESPIGVYELDLTNMDDFACDLIHGKAKISVLRRMYSDALFVVKEESITSADANKIYNKWEAEIGKGANREMNLFKAGMGFESLKSENNVQVEDTSVVLNLLKSLLDEKTGGFNFVGQTQLGCIVDSLQNYIAESVPHILNVEFKLHKKDSLSQGDTQ